MKPLRVPPGRLATHHLPRQAFDELCTGTVTETFIAEVNASLYSRRKLLLRALADFCAEHPAAVGPLTPMDVVWEFLATAEERDPATTREVLTHPSAGIWLTRTLRKIHGHETDSLPLWSEIGYLHSLVAVTAILTDVPCEIRLPVVHGVITLPGLGFVELPSSFPAGFADLSHCGTTTVRTPATGPITLDSEYFHAVRRHVTVSRGLRLEVEINDCDPYRELSAPLPPDRLDAPRFTEWRKMLDEAFDLLTLWHPEYARELAAGLRMLTPLPSGATIHGASSSVAIGCVAVPQKSSATALAETLVHEFQHSKLNGLLNLFDLGSQDDMYAPWRDDPRPLSGMLHGILAFFSVAEFWQVQRDLVPEHEARAAHFTFALRRRQVGEAIRSLHGHPALTQLGRTLLDAVRTRFLALEDHPVPPDVTAAVTRITDEHRATWRSRHVRPDPDDISRLANAWLAHTPPSTTVSTTVSASVRPNGNRAPQSSRKHLVQLAVTEPGSFADVVRHAALPAGDAAYVTGDYATATNAYLTRLRVDPEDAHTWIGLGLALAAREHPAAAAILAAPEVIIALYAKILTLSGAAPDPLRLAVWAGAGITRGTGPDPVQA